MAMIKCPECGHDVSDKAPQCPHCGVEIAGRNSAEEPSTNAEKQGENGTNGKKKGNNKYLIVALIVAFIVLCGVGYYLFSTTKGSEKELAEYEFAMKSNDTTILKHYIETYQDAPIDHISSIQQRIIELRKTDQAWTDAVVRGTKSALLKYLEDNPNSIHKDEAAHKIDSIDWETAKEINTVTSYQAYMNSRPDGDYFDEANEALRTLNTNTVQPEEELFISQLFRHFFQSLNNKDEEALTATVSNLLTSFLGKADATKADVLTFMNKIYKEDVTLMNWHTDGSFDIKKKEIGDQQYEYSVEFKVVQDVGHADNTSVRNNYKVKAKVNPEGKITEYNMTKQLE